MFYTHTSSVLVPPPPTNVNAWGKKYDKVVVSWTAPQNSTMSNQDYCVIESRSENSNQKIFGCFNCSTMIINSTYDLVGVKVSNNDNPYNEIKGKIASFARFVQL